MIPIVTIHFFSFEFLKTFIGKFIKYKMSGVKEQERMIHLIDLCHVFFQHYINRSLMEGFSGSYQINVTYHLETSMTSAIVLKFQMIKFHLSVFFLLQMRITVTCLQSNQSSIVFCTYYLYVSVLLDENLRHKNSLRSQDCLYFILQLTKAYYFMWVWVISYYFDWKTLDKRDLLRA